MRSLLFVLPVLVGCAGTTIQPGQRGLLFDPSSGGLKREVLQPGYHPVSVCMFRVSCPRIEVFDVSYQTKKEHVATTSSEGLTMDVAVAVNYRPIIAELYELNTEIGQNYYEDIVSPEFKSAAIGVFARHTHTELNKQNEKIEDEIEAELRHRIKGKHVEVSSVNIEKVSYSPDIAAAIEAKLVAEQNAAKNKAAMEAEALRKKLDLEHQAEQAKLKAELDIKAKKAEAEIAEAQAHIDKTKAETSASVQVTYAKAEAESKRLIADATAKENKAAYSHVTPLVVQMHGYEALAKLGGNGTQIYLGDWSKVPSFLFPYAMSGGVPPKAAKAAAVKPVVTENPDNPYR